MGPGDAEDWDEGEVAEEDDSSLGEPWPECLALVGGREKNRMISRGTACLITRINNNKT